MPLYVLTVIVALPFFFPVTSPLLFTVAILPLLVVHLSVFNEPLGRVAFRVYFLPFLIVSLVFFNFIPVGAFFTVILQIAFLPFVVVAVILIVPIFLATTLPFLSTDAILLKKYLYFVYINSEYRDIATK